MSCDQWLCHGVGAVCVGHSCPPYLGIRTQHVRGVGVWNARLMWLVTFVRIGLWRSGKRFWNADLIEAAVRNALQAPPFPLRRRPLRPPPQLLRKPDALCFPLSHSPLLLRGVTARGRWRVSIAWVLARSPLPSSLPFDGRRGGEATWGAWRLWVQAIRLLPPFRGEWVAGSSRSQESLVLADPDPVGSSSSPRGDCRSCSGGRGNYRRPLPLFPLLSPSGSSI